MGSHFSMTQKDKIQADKSRQHTSPRGGAEQYNVPASGIKSESSVDASKDNSIPAPAVYQLDPSPRTQLALDAPIRIGPYTLTFALAQRIAQDLRTSKSSPAIAELSLVREKSPSGSDLALYDIKLQLLDDYLILLNQSWVELPQALSDVLENKHLATLFNCAHGCCSHVAQDQTLAFICRNGVEIVGCGGQRKCMCVEINYACRCRTIYGCDKCPSRLIFSRHELADGRMMLVTTNWRNLGQCLDIGDDVWRSQTTGLNLLSTASHHRQTRFQAAEWIPLQGFTGLIPYEADTTSKMRGVADEAVR